MESVTCCFLSELKVLAGISKDCGVSVGFQQEPAAASPSSPLLRQPAVLTPRTEQPPPRRISDLDEGAQKVLVGRKMLCPLIRVFVHAGENCSGVPWLTAEHMYSCRQTL